MKQRRVLSILVLALALGAVTAAPAMAFAPQTIYLHAGGCLNYTAPTAPTPATSDSGSVNFSGGNPWKPVGTWTSTCAGGGSLHVYGDLHIWVGLKNSDDQGTQFDIQAAVTEGSTVTTMIRCVSGVTRNPSLAKEVVVPFTYVGSPSGTTSLTISVRIGTNSDGTKCAGHNNATGLRVYYDAVSRPSRFDGDFDD